jgi:hypothetical protein
MEFRIRLHQLEPPSGRVRALRDSDEAQEHVPAHEIEFSGWLGLLRALDEVTGRARGSPPGEAPADC